MQEERASDDLARRENGLKVLGSGVGVGVLGMCRRPRALPICAGLILAASVLNLFWSPQGSLLRWQTIATYQLHISKPLSGPSHEAAAAAVRVRRVVQRSHASNTSGISLSPRVSVSARPPRPPDNFNRSLNLIHARDGTNRTRARVLHLLRLVTVALRRSRVDYMLFGNTVLSYCRHVGHSSYLQIMINDKDKAAAIRSLTESKDGAGGDGDVNGRPPPPLPPARAKHINTTQSHLPHLFREGEFRWFYNHRLLLQQGLAVRLFREGEPEMGYRIEVARDVRNGGKGHGRHSGMGGNGGEGGEDGNGGEGGNRVHVTRPYIDLFLFKELKAGKQDTRHNTIAHRKTVNGETCAASFESGGRWYDNECVRTKSGSHGEPRRERCPLARDTNVWQFCAPRFLRSAPQRGAAQRVASASRRHSSNLRRWAGGRVAVAKRYSREERLSGGAAGLQAKYRRFHRNHLTFPAELLLPTVAMEFEGVPVRGPREAGMYLQWGHKYSKEAALRCPLGPNDLNANERLYSSAGFKRLILLMRRQHGEGTGKRIGE